MREIVFRGKRMDNGEWAEGDLLRAKHYLDDTGHCFLFTNAEAFPANEFCGYAEVDPSTVGQYTGLTDKNGVRIFEGDIVKTIRYGKYINFWVVGFNCGAFEFRNGECRMDCGTFDYDYVDFSEIIGNIYDNKELITA